MQTLREAQEMTLYEYSLRLKAHEYKMIDDAHDLHYHAWLVARVIPARDKKGDAVIKSFNDIFNKEEIEREISGEKQREKNETFNLLRERHRRMQEFENMRGKEENNE